MRCNVYSMLELIKKFTVDLTIDKGRVFEVCKYNEVARLDAHIQNAIVCRLFSFTSTMTRGKNEEKKYIISYLLRNHKTALATANRTP